MELDTRSIPKVKLDSHADALYISEALRTAAKRAVQERSNSIADSEVLFNRAQTLVDKIIDQTMIASAGSIQINGLDWMPSMPVDHGESSCYFPKNRKLTSTPDMEPYDEGLNRRLQELQVELERQTIKVTQQRKNLPLDIKERLQHTLKATAIQAKDHSELLPTQIEFAERSSATDPSLEIVHKDYQSALAIMAHLAKEAPANLSALQRAYDIIGEMQH